MAQQRFPLLVRGLKELRQSFLAQCRGDVPGLLAARTHAQGVLEALRNAFAEEPLPKTGWCLVAVGGFGRGELSYSSDLDIFFLYRNKLGQPLADAIRELVYLLWDGGFEVGHATASVSTAMQMVREDFTILTNHLEARLIFGDRELFDSWREDFLGSFGSRRQRSFLQALIRYREGRLHHYGESSYLLEPHVKEGVGGLRDLHTIRWAGGVFLQNAEFTSMTNRDWLSAQEQRWLEQAHDFLWRVRLQLHHLTGRRQDQLLFPEQEQIALRFGYTDGHQGSAVEAFMRLYYRHTARIRRTASFLLERLETEGRRFPRLRSRPRVLPGPFLLDGKHLHFMEPEWIRKDPRLLMRFFWQAAQSGAHFHHQAGQVIRENLDAFTEEARTDPEVVKQFIDILLDPQHAFRILKVMLETGFLDVFIPQFAQVRYRVQHDVYHLYTVDEHLLRTVRELHVMERQTEDSPAGMMERDIFVQLENRRILYLAALLHDIGKGQGKNHAVRGAAMVKDTAIRLGLTSGEAELLSFLIEMHLLLPDTALKRDLLDEKPILKCAVEIGDREKLRLLYLLSIADSRATGPGAWNTWKASLLRELYTKVDRLLSREWWEKDDLRKRSTDAQQVVLALVEDAGERQQIALWLDTLSLRYLFSQSPRDIVDHYRMELELVGRPLSFRSTRTEGEMWQVTMATHDRPGLFALLTGVLWVRGLNILSADIFTRQSGVALDVLMVERLPDPLHSDELFERIKNDLIRSLSDRPYLDELLAGKRKPSLLQKTLPRKEDRVVIDEEASDFYTIIEVYTWDRPGVLHAISNVLYEQGVSIQLAKISTPGAQVADVFYVTDMNGDKLLDPLFHERVRSKLLECLTTIV